MAESKISGVSVTTEQEQYSANDDITINIGFSIQGGLREAFNEKSWTVAYNKNDLALKIKYGVKLSSGGLRKRSLGKAIDTYRKATVFWTRNPKLVNAMKDKRIWAHVIKNFQSYVRLTESETREELFDFSEKITFKAKELGSGKHKVSAEIWTSWQKHYYTEPESLNAKSSDVEITIN